MESIFVEMVSQFGSLGLAGIVIWWVLTRTIPHIQEQLSEELREARKERMEARIERAEFRDVLREITSDHRAAEADFARSLERMTEGIEEVKRRTGPHPKPQ